jgi:hypothetical protein
MGPPFNTIPFLTDHYKLELTLNLSFRQDEFARKLLKNRSAFRQIPLDKTLAVAPLFLVKLWIKEYVNQG